MPYRPAQPERPRRRGRPAAARGFTLAEVLTVVVILGVLAALVIAVYRWAISDARAVAFVTDVKTFARSAELYAVRNRAYPPSAAGGELPGDWAREIDPNKWLAPTPIGGRWVASRNENGFGFGIGIDFLDSDVFDEDGVMQALVVAEIESVDRQIDDGNPETGRFRRVQQGRYFFVVAE